MTIRTLFITSLLIFNFTYINAQKKDSVRYTSAISFNLKTATKTDSTGRLKILTSEVRPSSPSVDTVRTFYVRKKENKKVKNQK